MCFEEADFLFGYIDNNYQNLLSYPVCCNDLSTGQLTSAIHLGSDDVVKYL